MKVINLTFSRNLVRAFCQLFSSSSWEQPILPRMIFFRGKSLMILIDTLSFSWLPTALFNLRTKELLFPQLLAGFSHEIQVELFRGTSLKFSSLTHTPQQLPTSSAPFARKIAHQIHPTLQGQQSTFFNWEGNAFPTKNFFAWLLQPFQDISHLILLFSGSCQKHLHILHTNEKES